MPYYPNRPEGYQIMRIRNAPDYDTETIALLCYLNLRQGDVVPLPAPKKGWKPDGATESRLGEFVKYTIKRGVTPSGNKYIGVTAHFIVGDQKVKYTYINNRAPISILWTAAILSSNHLKPWNMHYREIVGDLREIAVRDPAVHVLENGVLYAQDVDMYKTLTCNGFRVDEKNLIFC